MASCDRERLEREVIAKMKLAQDASSRGDSSGTSLHPAECDVLRRFEFAPTFFGYKFSDRRSPLVRGHPWRHPSLDIFFVHLPGSAAAGYDASSSAARVAQASVPRLPFVSARAQKAFGRMNFMAHECFVPQQTDSTLAAHAVEQRGAEEPKGALPRCASYHSDRHCLQLQAFGPLHLWACAPAAASAYLSRCYGADWYNVAYRTFDHAVERKLTPQEQRRRVMLDDDMRRPALPLQPLPHFRIE